MDTFDCAGPPQKAGGWMVRWLPPLLLFALGIWLVPLAHTCQLACVPGDLGDARFNGVVLEHLHRWLLGQDPSLISPPFFYPMPGASTFSDNHWGTAWIYSVYRAMGWDRYQAFDLWYLTGFVANFVVSHLVFRRMRFSPLASAVAAFAFTFAMPVLARHGHAQLTYRLLVPVGLLMWQRFAADLRWRWLAALSLAIAGQFYISIYLGYFLSLLVAAWAVAQWGLDGVGPRAWFSQWGQWRQAGDRHELFGSIVVITLAGIALVFLMYPYLHYSRLYGFQRGLGEIASMTPRLQSYLLADQSGLWGRVSAMVGAQVPMRHEQQMFFGGGVLGLAALGLFRPSLRLCLVAALSIALLMLLTLTIGKVSLYLLLAHLPGVDSVRAVARIGLVMILPLSILVAAGVDALWRGKLVARLLVVALVGLMMVESMTLHTAHFDRRQAQERIAVLRAGLPARLPDGVVVFNPIRPDVPFYESELDGAILGQDVGRPTLNGYSGNLPPGYDPQPAESPCVQALLRLQAAKRSSLLSSVNVGTIHDHVMIVPDAQSCGRLSAQVMRLSDASRVVIHISSMDKVGETFRVRVRVTNGADMPLNTASDMPQPLHLSWQVIGSSGVPDPEGWKPRVELPGQGTLAPGEARDVVFTVPNAGAHGGARIVVSAVLEGRAWLHEHGLVMQDAVLEAPAP